MVVLDPKIARRGPFEHCGLKFTINEDKADFAAIHYGRHERLKQGWPFGHDFGLL